MPSVITVSRLLAKLPGISPAVLGRASAPSAKRSPSPPAISSMYPMGNNATAVTNVSKT